MFFFFFFLFSTSKRATSNRTPVEEQKREIQRPSSRHRNFILVQLQTKIPHIFPSSRSKNLHSSSPVPIFPLSSPQGSAEPLKSFKMADSRDLPPRRGAGIVKSIRLENFMCHSNLYIEFGEWLNFITGQNGSKWIRRSFFFLGFICFFTHLCLKEFV